MGNNNTLSECLYFVKKKKKSRPEHCYFSHLKVRVYVFKLV